MILSERAGGRQSHLLTAEVVRGTCPDMCPEKERYMREDRRRLSVFEMIPGTDLVWAYQLITMCSLFLEMNLKHSVRVGEISCYLLEFMIGFWS